MKKHVRFKFIINYIKDLLSGDVWDEPAQHRKDE